MNKKTVQFPAPSNGDVWTEQDIREFMEEFGEDEDSLTGFLQE